MRLCVAHSETSFRRKEPFADKEMNEAYALFTEESMRNGVKVLLTKSVYVRAGYTTKNFLFDKSWKKINKCKFDLVYDKFDYSKFEKNLRKRLNRKNLVFNEPTFGIICKDKLLTSIIFPKLCKQAFLARENMNKIIKKIKSNRVIVKPRFGQCSKGIKVLKKNDLKQIKLGDNYLVQSFIDSSKGIPRNEKINTTHDLRVHVVNGKLNHSFVRIPAKNKAFCTNVKDGGQEIQMKMKDVPYEVKKAVKKIDKVFEKSFPTRIYSADFAIEKNKPWLIELNSKPSFVEYSTASQKKFFSAIINALADAHAV